MLFLMALFLLHQGLVVHEYCRRKTPIEKRIMAGMAQGIK
jgi:hypothetical protein